MASQEQIQQEVRRASEVQARYADQLMSKAHVVGVAVGYTAQGGETTSDIGVIVMVDQKLPSDELDPEDLIPRELDGVRVDVQETGVFHAQ